MNRAEAFELLKKYSTSSIVGFGMFISGILVCIVFRQVASEAIWDGMTLVGLFTIIILGTVVSFNAYIEGVRRIGAIQGSILSSLEPISAALFGWALLGNEFTLVGIFGMFCIIATVFIIAWDRQRQLKRDVLEKLNKEENITVLHITHYMEEAVQADRVIVMDKGRKVLEGTPKEVFRNVKMLKEIGLDVPYMTELATSLREEGIEINDDILTVDEMVVKLCRLL